MEHTTRQKQKDKREKLTKTVIDRLEYPESLKQVGDTNGGKYPVHILWDTETRGFGCRVFCSGVKSFLIDYRLSGKQRRMTIGQFGEITVDTARKMAKEKLAEVLQGKDPLQAKQDSRKGGETLKDLATAYLEQCSKPHKRSSKEDERRLKQHILPVLGKKRIDDIRRSDVMTLHNALGKKHPYEANRCLALISVMFTFATRTGMVPDTYPNPARLIQKYPEHKRDRWVTEAELPRLMDAINAHPNVYIRAAITLYLLTGLRKSELLRVEWDWVDFDEKTVRIPGTKNGRVHTLPLSEAALAVLKEIPRIEGNPYLLPGKLEGRHLVNVDIPWRTIRKAAKLPDVHLHDLRRTCGSLMATGGVPINVIQKVLNHRDLATTASVYAHLAQDPIRQALDAHGDKILKFSDIQREREEQQAVAV